MRIVVSSNAAMVAVTSTVTVLGNGQDESEASFFRFFKNQSFGKLDPCTSTSAAVVSPLAATELSFTRS